jgi:hypothetical protein
MRLLVKAVFFVGTVLILTGCSKTDPPPSTDGPKDKPGKMDVKPPPLPTMPGK